MRGVIGRSGGEERQWTGSGEERQEERTLRKRSVWGRGLKWEREVKGEGKGPAGVRGE